MKNTTKLIGMLALGAFALGPVGVVRAADANPPERMTYQGYLVDGNGDPLGSVVDPSDSSQRVSAPTNYDIVFRVYKEKSGSQDAIWAEQQTVTVDKGYFSVLLGEGSTYLNEPNGSTGTNLSSVMRGADISDRYIGLTVDTGSGASEIAPRLRLVTSPFAFTASQAMKLTDSAGNSNFFKDGTSLKLGAGSTPTLTLPEAGSATLVGKLTADLPGWGSGLQIDNGALTTTFGAESSNFFHIRTGLPGFYFDKQIEVNGDIRSLLDTVIGPKSNTDTYLKISKGSDDKISAYSNAFRVEDEANNSYLEINPNSSGVQFSTGSGTFQMTKPLEVTGNLSATGTLTSGGNITITKPDNEEAVLSLRGSGQGTGRLFVGQSSSYGGGIIYNGDSNPAFAGSTEDAISFYRTHDWAHHEVFRYKTSSNDVTFNGKVGIGTDSPSTLLHLNATTDAEVKMNNVYHTVFGIQYLLSSNPVDTGAYGVLMIGSREGAHIRVDPNEIMAVSNNSAATLYLNANGGTVKAGSATVTSDKRLKRNIHPIKYGLSELRELKPVSYDWKLDLFNLPGTQLGFIAQDVQKVLPELVMVEEDAEESRFKDELSLNVNGIMPVVVASVQELDKENRRLDSEMTALKAILANSTAQNDLDVEDLQNENETLKSKVETLTSEMAVLKTRLANSTTQEDRIAKLEELVSKIGQGE